MLEIKILSSRSSSILELKLKETLIGPLTSCPLDLEWLYYAQSLWELDLLNVSNRDKIGVHATFICHFAVSPVNFNNSQLRQLVELYAKSMRSFFLLHYL